MRWRHNIYQCSRAKYLNFIPDVQVVSVTYHQKLLETYEFNLQSLKKSILVFLLINEMNSCFLTININTKPKSIKKKWENNHSIFPTIPGKVQAPIHQPWGNHTSTLFHKHPSTKESLLRLYNKQNKTKGNVIDTGRWNDRKLIPTSHFWLRAF